MYVIHILDVLKVRYKLNGNIFINPLQVYPPRSILSIWSPYLQDNALRLEVKHAKWLITPQHGRKVVVFK